MTGYGIGTAPLGRGRLIVEARSVNHRYLDVRVRMPAEIAEYARYCDAIVRKLADRGKIEINGRIEGQIGGELEINRQRAKQAFRALSDLRDELCPNEPIPLSVLSSVPELFALRNTPNVEDISQAVASATEQACLELSKMRASEGASLASDLVRRLEFIRGQVEKVRVHFPDLVLTYRERLRARVEKLLTDCACTLDPGRLEHEVALFADRSDVSEELVRIQSHCDQFASMVESASNGPIGRRMDFLLQEMIREANTLGSKISDVAVTHLTVELKAELERMREQVQNVL